MKYKKIRLVSLPLIGLAMISGGLLVSSKKILNDTFENNLSSNINEKNHFTIDKVASGSHYEAAIVDDKKGGKDQLYTWGSNKDGELGYPVDEGVDKFVQDEPKLVPFFVDSNLTIEDVELGYGSTMVWANDGVHDHIYTWGSNEHGSLGTGQDKPSDYNPHEVIIPGLQEDNAHVIDIANSGGFGNKDHMGVAVGGNGMDKLYAWGSNSNGEVGIGESSDAVYEPKRIRVPELDSGATIKQISYGLGYSALVEHIFHTDVLFMWGKNSSGELATGNYDDGTNKPKSIVKLPGKDKDKTIVIQDSTSNSVAISETFMTDDKMITHDYTWGGNSDGQLGVGKIAGHNGIANPTEVKWAGIDDQSTEHFIQSSLGWRSSMAMTEDNDGNQHLWVVGLNEYGQFADNHRTSKFTTEYREIEKEDFWKGKSLIWSGETIKQIGFGGKGTPQVLTTDSVGNDHLYSWGCNDYGQAGTWTWGRYGDNNNGNNNRNRDDDYHIWYSQFIPAEVHFNSSRSLAKISDPFNVRYGHNSHGYETVSFNIEIDEGKNQGRISNIFESHSDEINVTEINEHGWKFQEDKNENYIELTSLKSDSLTPSSIWFKTTLESGMETVTKTFTFKKTSISNPTNMVITDDPESDVNNGAEFDVNIDSGNYDNTPNKATLETDSGNVTTTADDGQLHEGVNHIVVSGIDNPTQIYVYVNINVYSKSSPTINKEYKINLSKEATISDAMNMTFKYTGAEFDVNLTNGSHYEEVDKATLETTFGEVTTTAEDGQLHEGMNHIIVSKLGIGWTPSRTNVKITTHSTQGTIITKNYKIDISKKTTLFKANISDSMNKTFKNDGAEFDVRLTDGILDGKVDKATLETTNGTVTTTADDGQLHEGMNHIVVSGLGTNGDVSSYTYVKISTHSKMANVNKNYEISLKNHKGTVLNPYNAEKTKDGEEFDIDILDGNGIGAIKSMDLKFISKYNETIKTSSSDGLLHIGTNHIIVENLEHIDENSKIEITLKSSMGKTTKNISMNMLTNKISKKSNWKVITAITAITTLSIVILLSIIISSILILRKRRNNTDDFSISNNYWNNSKF